MSKQFPPKYFIDLFSAIPAKKWMTKNMGFSGRARCALGHIESVSAGRYKQYLRLQQALGAIIAETVRGRKNKSLVSTFDLSPYDPIVLVNDTNKVVKANGPRSRILKVLRQAQKKGIV